MRARQRWSVLPRVRAHACVRACVCVLLAFASVSVCVRVFIFMCVCSVLGLPISSALTRAGAPSHACARTRTPPRPARGVFNALVAAAEAALELGCEGAVFDALSAHDALESALAGRPPPAQPAVSATE